MESKLKIYIKRLFLTLLFLSAISLGNAQTLKTKSKGQLMGNRFLTLNTVIRVNQIEVSRNRSIGEDERAVHTPARVIAFRRAIAVGFPGGKITWAFSWLALNDKSPEYREIRRLVVSYVKKYGDEITFIPGAYFANAYNTTEQVNKDVHDALQIITNLVGNGYRPKSILAGFMSAKSQQYLAEKENIHVCQGNIWSQFSIDNQDGDGSVSYPFYPSKEHFCKPSQNKSDFIDCVNLDGWTVDFLAARRAGFADGFNSRLSVGPIETIGKYGPEVGIKQMMHATAIHFDQGIQLNKFAWVTNCWELCLPYKPEYLKNWLEQVKKRWPNTKLITQAEFGLLWRKNYKSNSFDYRFEEKGSGVGGSDAGEEISWYMNKDFRMALLQTDSDPDSKKVIDFTNYTLTAHEPADMTRKWSLLGEINQKGTRQQDRPSPFDSLKAASRRLILQHYPELKKDF